MYIGGSLEVNSYEFSKLPSWMDAVFKESQALQMEKDKYSYAILVKVY